MKMNEWQPQRLTRRLLVNGMKFDDLLNQQIE